ncbi:sensor histidine kinase [Actinokineospora sp. G85]|uniref:sensor histidine kinase n=1 Tax=Actinokineospora sp. G85 TaxID=3406626 RepID=UPI003C719758
MHPDDVGSPGGRVPTEELSARAVARGWPRAAVSLAAGGVLSALEVAFLCGRLVVWVLSWLPGSTGRARVVDRQARAFTELQLRRIRRFHGPVHTQALTAERCKRYLGLRWLVGGLGTGVLVLLAVCLAVAGSMISAWAFDGGWGLIENADGRVDLGLLAVAAPPGTMLTFVTAVGVLAVGSLDRWLAIEGLGYSDQVLLRRRVVDLTTTRADVIEAIDDERRRIERDLHDGVQQRVVALGLLVSRARRASTSGTPAHDLLEQAQAVAQETISELREVALRVYPSTLDGGGVPAALESLAERSSVPVRLDVALAGRLPSTVETVVYFVASEAVNNAIKHADPSAVVVSVTAAGDHVTVTITDDGRGGADPSGTGLSGLARRVAAVDGRFAVDSPVGGPTVVRAELPCG